MLYFIPAWYKQNMWCENEQQWYMRRLKSEFDETIKQITLFHRNVDRPYRILVLGYSPNFRHSYTGRACTAQSTGHALMR